MSLDRRSFKVGIIAGVFLITGVVAGIVFSSRLGWLPSAASSPTEAAATMAPAVSGPTPPNFVAVVKAVMPAVVNISTRRTVRSQGGDVPSQFQDDPFFRQFFGDEFFHRFQMPRERRESSLGSGVIVDSSGYIITNNHVVAKADEIKVLLNDKREFTGKVVGTDPKSDIAIVKINAKDLPVIPWGDSDKLDVGEYVLAIGNPFGLNQTVTQGIVSAVGRANVGIADYEDFIQTDAAINPGNSGGALVNSRGQLVGINTAIFSRSGGYMGIGFAVPSNMTRSVMDSLIKTGKVVRGWLGVSIQEVTPDLAKQFGMKESRGALVSEVIPDSPAAAAGIQSGDIITAFNGKAVDSPSTLRNTVAQTLVGKSVKVEVLRDKKPVTMDVKISEQPKDIAQAEGDTAQGDGKDTALAGIEVRNLTPDIAHQLGLPPGTAGVVIAGVEQGSAAEEAGLQEGDVIMQINRQPVRNIGDFKRLAGKLSKKDSTLLLINRQGRKLFIAIRP
ncbi:MAG: DegQ family serine endoprotease [Sulfuricaulis sp.]|uniref:DegQ family serine endoprotease n=1 Tax=Sulfuricaulis sp. TaxID=2003553 RepID=UPI003C6A4DBF